MIIKIAALMFLITPCICKYLIFGPAKVTITRAEECRDVHNLTVQSSYRIHMFNRTTQVLDANISMPFDLDETVGVSLKCSRIDKKQNPFTIESKDACHTLTNYVGELWADIEKQLGIPQFCPVKKGFYSVKNYYLDLALLKVKAIFEGSFYTRIMLKKEDVVVFCNDYDLKLEPKT